MKQLVVLSGKGGTGKTTVTAALGHLAAQELSVVLADGDVDAANLELVLEPRKLEEHDFVSGKRAVIDPERCTACGICESVCRFDAIQPPTVTSSREAYQVHGLSCEGCAACFYQCPEEAIRMEDQLAGRWFRSESRFGPLFHAHLFAGQENSGKLVTLVKQQGRLLASDTGAQLLLVDGPPGIGCPVISASAGADMALLVVEPTVAGVHDLERVLGTTEHFGVPALVVLNKADLNPNRSDQVAAFCAENGIELVGRIPYDNIVTEAMVQGLPVTAYADGAVSAALRDVWERVKIRLALET
ncbi:MAG: ATP-binding protein [Chloroflexota bacterium]|nr:ATP-binding protein [Chloroflexota bacterium]